MDSERLLFLFGHVLVVFGGFVVFTAAMLLASPLAGQPNFEMLLLSACIFGTGMVRGGRQIFAKDDVVAYAGAYAERAANAMPWAFTWIVVVAFGLVLAVSSVLVFLMEFFDFLSRAHFEGITLVALSAGAGLSCGLVSLFMKKSFFFK